MSRRDVDRILSDPRKLRLIARALKPLLSSSPLVGKIGYHAIVPRSPDKEVKVSKPVRRPWLCRHKAHNWVRPLVGCGTCGDHLVRSELYKICLRCEAVQRWMGTHNDKELWEIVLDPIFCGGCDCRRKRRKTSPFEVMGGDAIAKPRRKGKPRPIDSDLGDVL